MLCMNFALYKCWHNNNNNNNNNILDELTTDL